MALVTIELLSKSSPNRVSNGAPLGAPGAGTGEERRAGNKNKSEFRDRERISLAWGLRGPERDEVTEFAASVCVCVCCARGGSQGQVFPKLYVASCRITL